MIRMPFISVTANALGTLHVRFQVKTWRQIDQICYYFTESEGKGILCF